MDIKTAIKAVTERQNLSVSDMTTVMREIMTGGATPAQIGGFLIGLRMKGETIEEITAAAQVMRELVLPVKVHDTHLIDIVGTGGDGTHTFNISTVSAFVVAAVGGKVAKHGNRSVSSSSGSADVLEALGVKISLSAEQVAQCINEVGMGFMFAPHYHNAMKHAIAPRKEMGVRTIFNLLGPLTNPAMTPNLLIGVYHVDWVKPIAQVMQQLGSYHVLVVHAEDGLDEISIAAPTQVAELRHDIIKTYVISPESLGLSRASLDSIRVNNVAESVQIIQDVLDNKPFPARDTVLLNAGAAIYTANLTDTLEQGIRHAHGVLRNGEARKKLEALIEFTQRF